VPRTGLRSHPSNLIRFAPAKGVTTVPRCLTIATSDSGGGAGIQADLKAFAAAGCHGMSALVALTAQNTVAVTAVHELPSEFVVAQLEAVFGDIGVDAAKTGMLFSRRLIETVADYLDGRGVPLVVDPVMVASSGARLLQEDAVATYVERLFPLATVVTPNLPEAEALASLSGPRRALAERIRELGAPAVVITGGHGEETGDLLLDDKGELLVPVVRHERHATHGSGCTHSATLTAHLARGSSLRDAARAAAAAASRAVGHGLKELGAGEGPVDVLAVSAR
jgi:hydroxymethylpyrimidine/phosphomethylpyrimidine kinase